MYLHVKIYEVHLQCDSLYLWWLYTPSYLSIHVSLTHYLGTLSSSTYCHVCDFFVLKLDVSILATFGLARESAGAEHSNGLGEEIHQAFYPFLAMNVSAYPKFVTLLLTPKNNKMKIHVSVMVLKLWRWRRSSCSGVLCAEHWLIFCTQGRRSMIGILPIWRKTQNNQSINLIKVGIKPINQSI